ncbi:MAG: thymidine kinase, partial [Lysinibacillus sp.]
MAQLYFKHGAMNSGKSIEILKVAHNYEEQNKPVMMFTPGIDTRDEVGYISSRVGLRQQAIPVNENTNIFEIVKNNEVKPYCVLVDEVQFLKKDHVLQLANIVDALDIPVMGFGLKNDFQNELFEGSRYFLIYADKIEEMKTICWF